MGKLPLLCSPHNPGTRLNDMAAKNERICLPPDDFGTFGGVEI